ncbi:MAG: hypothetical protein IJJ99_03590 [Oscillospiraceae bacterium]|nr:hypothetical protein [Oscillospiraceae bacterium]
MKTISEILMQPLGIGLRLAAMLLMIGSLCVLLLTVSQRRGALPILLCAIHALFDLCLLTLLLDGAYRIDYLLEYAGYTRAYPPVVLWTMGLPYAAVAAAEGTSFLLLLLHVYRILRFARNHPTVQSVKQTVDLLPTAICISDESGLILLSNLKMNEYLRALTGSIYSGADALWQAITERGARQGEQYLLRLEDGTTLLAGRTELTMDGQTRVQITCEDVTEQYRKTAEMNEKNERLKELQLRLKRYRQEQAELVVRQELLAARTTVHDQLGSVLLMGKYHLEHPERTDPKTLRLLLEQLNVSLRSETEAQEQDVDAALQTAAGFGVEVSITGTPPRDRALRLLLGQAIAECAVNTVKHAHGSRLQVVIHEDSFEITNDGMPPEGEIVPSGGLQSLRLAAANAGCRMELESAPRFRLIIL